LRGFRLCCHYWIMKSKKPEILTYKSTVGFLKDWYAWQVGMRSGFSYRKWATMAGFSSPNFMHLVLSGKRSLSEKSLPSVINTLNLKLYEQDYFELLFKLEKSKSLEQRKKLIAKVIKIRRNHGKENLSDDIFYLYENPVRVFIREFVMLPDFNLTEEYLISKLPKGISPLQFKKELEKLVEKGFVERDKEGRYTTSSKNISTGDDVSSVALSTFQRTMIDQSLESLEEVSSDLREITSLTLRLSSRQIKELKGKIKSFKKEILSMEDQEKSDGVYQVNFQVFPLSNASALNNNVLKS
jgi:uncharacterized protein (TIGR02147 family)